MKQTLKIISVRAKPFKGQDGSDIMYFWYTAVRGDGVQIQFGSLYEYTEGENAEVDLIKTESARGGIIYKEIRNA